MRRFALLLALFVTSLIAPSAASAAAPVCRGPEGGGFSGCLGVSPVSSGALRTSFETSDARGDVGDTIQSLASEAPGRKAGTGLIALVWAMTLLGFGTAVMLLRRQIPPPPEPAQA